MTATTTSEHTQRPGYDAITFSVILSRLDSIASEMTLTLERSAWTSILALSRDFSCAVYDAANRQVAMYDALPIHTTSMQLVLAEIARVFDGDVADGDVFLCNDPYSNNTHIGDLVTAAPVFVDGELSFWAVTKGHQMDTGAFVPSSLTASAQNIWQEGIRIPPTKLVDAGAFREDVGRMYLANVRYTELLEGDLWAQLGSIEKGKQRLVELCEEYGRGEILAYVDDIIDYAHRRMSQEVRAMPDGVYTADAWIDSDGFDQEHIPVKVTVTIDGEDVTVDYTGSAPQVKGGSNGTYAVAQAAGAVPFLYYIDPDIPHNHGCIEHVDVIAPKGTVVNAEYPAATSCATVVPGDLLQDIVNKAMVQAMPERVPAGSTRCGNVPQFAGETDRDGKPWGFMLFHNAGGMGASMGTDGWPLLVSQAGLGGMKIMAIEQLELLYPIRIERAEIAPESMGFGEWIGGAGTNVVVKPLAGDLVCISFGDGCANPPHGALGGTPGIGGGQWVEHRANDHRRFVSASGNIMVDGEEEVWEGVSTGGGGFGRPCDRDAELVRIGVRDDILTRETARSVFGVALSADIDPVIDDAETAVLRAALQDRAYAPVDPIVPNAATWLQATRRDGDEYLLNPLV